MSNAGRPPKALQEKILAGARVRKDRDADAKVANAAVKLAMPPCPSWLINKKGAKKHWDILGPKLVEVGLIAETDGDVFALHCQNVADYESVIEKLENIDAWVTTTPNGFQVQAAYFQIRNKLQEMIIRTAKEFGLTPASRSNVKIDKPKQQTLFDTNEKQSSPFSVRRS